MSLKIIQLSKHFDDKYLYKKVDFEFADCGLYIIHGESGIGKTTLLNLLDDLDREYTGEIILNETNIKDNPTFVRDNISYCQSEDVLFDNLSVKDNLLIVDSDISNIETLLSKFNLSTKKNSLVKKLSQGQRSRIAIIKYLLKRANVYLFDEPTENLDKATADVIFAEIEEKAKKSLVIFVSHSTEYDSKADYVLSIKDFNIICEKQCNLGKAKKDRIINNEFNYDLFKLFRCFFKKITVTGSLFLIGTILMVTALTLSLNYSFLTDRSIFNQILTDNNTEYARVDNTKDEILEKYDYLSNSSLIKSDFIINVDGQSSSYINSNSYISTTKEFVINNNKYDLDQNKTIDGVEYFPIAVSLNYANYNSLDLDSTISGNCIAVSYIQKVNFYISDIFKSETDFQPDIIVPYESIKNSLTDGFCSFNSCTFDNLTNLLDSNIYSFFRTTDEPYINVIDDSHYIAPVKKNQFNLLIPKDKIVAKKDYNDFFETTLLNKTFEVVNPSNNYQSFELNEYISDYEIVGYKEVEDDTSINPSLIQGYALELNNNIFQDINSNILYNSYLTSIRSGIVLQKDTISQNKLFNTSLNFYYFGNVSTESYLSLIYQRNFYTTMFAAITFILFIIYLFFDHGFINSLIGEKSNYFKVLRNDGLLKKQIFKIYLAIFGCILFLGEVIGVIIGNVVGKLYLSPLILTGINTSLNMFNFNFLAMLSQILISVLITFLIYLSVFSKRIKIDK